MFKKLLFFIFFLSIIVFSNSIHRINDDIVYGPILEEEQSIYYFSRPGQIYALSLSQTRTEINRAWNANLGKEIVATPVFSKPNLIIPAENGQIFFVNTQRRGSEINLVETLNYSINDLYIEESFATRNLYVSTQNSVIAYTVTDTSLIKKWEYVFKDLSDFYERREIPNRLVKWTGDFSKIQPPDLSRTSKVAICNFASPYLFVQKENKMYRIPKNWDQFSIESIRTIEIGNDFWISAPPVCYNNRIYLSSTDNKLFSINVNNLEDVIEIPLQGWISTKPVFFENKIIFTTFDNTLHIYDIDPNGLIPFWKKEIIQVPLFSKIQIVEQENLNPYLIIAGRDSIIRSYEIDTGDIKFSINSGQGIASGWPLTPLVIGLDKLLISTTTGDISLIDTSKSCSFNVEQKNILETNSITSINGIAYHPYGPYSIEVSFTSRLIQEYDFEEILKINETTPNSVEFSYTFDPTQTTATIVQIACRVVPENSPAQREPYSTVYFEKPLTAIIRQLTVLEIPQEISTNTKQNLTVIEMEGQRPISGAIVSISSRLQSNEYITGPDGTIEFILNHNELYTIEITATGYRGVRFSLDMTRSSGLPMEIIGIFIVIMLIIGSFIFIVKNKGFGRNSNKPLRPDEIYKKKIK